VTPSFDCWKRSGPGVKVLLGYSNTGEARLPGRSWTSGGVEEARLPGELLSGTVVGAGSLEVSGSEVVTWELEGAEVRFNPRSNTGSDYVAQCGSGLEGAGSAAGWLFPGAVAVLVVSGCVAVRVLRRKAGGA
jgi:hypothetical protein